MPEIDVSGPAYFFTILAGVMFFLGYLAFVFLWLRQDKETPHLPFWGGAPDSWTAESPIKKKP